ncbi:altered inheritance of mitochondria protein 3 [Zygosaccharomyces mellis]|uniref:Altered inheritance of mitochondria protein 3 n=1 Tax=Zygosaccharomyces mellis TaxID=42258 RepID=A0A4C2E4X5_9SACH|nr:altered inheritance of mitochondria protein 3 [Zygosaccharomyces mellis]
MSDFWERNKGSITSGLKKTGKAGLSGTKYVAKTGYQAGKKNWNSNKKNKTGKKPDEENFDDELDDHSRYYPSYSSHSMNPSAFPPPPSRTNPSQNISGENTSVPPPLQPSTQQPAYQQPAYQQPVYTVQDSQQGQFGVQQPSMPPLHPGDQQYPSQYGHEEAPRVTSQQQTTQTSYQQSFPPLPPRSSQAIKQPPVPPRSGYQRSSLPQSQMGYQQPPALSQTEYQPQPPAQSSYQQFPAQHVHSVSPPQRSSNQNSTPIQPQSTANSQTRPYDLTAPHIKQRFEIPSVDLANLPSPPTHRDRNSQSKTRESSPGPRPQNTMLGSSPPPTYENSQRTAQNTSLSSLVPPSVQSPSTPHTESTSFLPGSNAPLPPMRPKSNQPAMVDPSLFPPPPRPKQTVSTERELLLKNQDSSAGPIPHGRLAGSKTPPPPVKPKPSNLTARSGTAASSKSTPAASVDSISQELSRVQLKKGNSKYTQEPTPSKLPPPAVPKKNVTLDKTGSSLPPNKNNSLKSPTDQQEVNPFERYLKSAVPAENDRLHKPI